MNLIQSLMGRRQFLVAAGLTSASALACKKLSGVVDPVFQSNTANAAEMSGAAGLKGTSNKYSNLLSPLQIGNVILKNRIYSTDSFPIGLEASLGEKGISHYIINRAKNGASSHPTGYNSVKDKPMTLRFAEAIKKSGAKIVVAPNGGYHDLDLCEEYIASGKADIIAMARSFICDPEYGQKVYEGRGEDVVPCILCNKCHGPTQQGPDPAMCSVNPKLGLEDKLDRMIAAPAASKKVAVIGGDLIGAQTGIYLAEDGHRVTILSNVSTLASDAPAIHYKTNLEMKYEALRSFSFITQAAATGISAGKATYFDTQGNKKSVQADSVVISLGRKSRKEEAMKFSGSAGLFFVIGDCNVAGSVRTCNRAAFAAASQI